jgi:hypothetical protein
MPNLFLTNYEDKVYPFLTVWEAFNSKEYYYYPEFIKAGRKPTVFDDLISFVTDIIRQIYNIIRGWS